MDYYDTDQIIRHAQITHTDISPNERQDWVMFGVALRVLGYNETTFAALSWSDPNTQRICRKVWQDNRSVRMTEDAAKAKIIALAKEAGMDLKEFRLSRNEGKKAITQITRNYPAKPIQQQQKPELPRVFIPMEEVEEAAGRVEQTTLYKYLCSLLSPDEVKNAFNAYLVGATSEFGSVPGYASAFPYINIKGECVDVHLQPYEEDGHRWKKERHPYSHNWLLTMKHGKEKAHDIRAPWPLFGEHLLPSRPSAPVGIVESEKTALIASILAPGYVWTATASLANLNARRLAAVKDRECYVFPDLDGLDKWREKTAALAKEGFKVFFCGQYIQDNATPGSKEDLADIILRHRHTAHEEPRTHQAESNEADEVEPQDDPMPTPGTPEYSAWCGRLAKRVCSKRI